MYTYEMIGAASDNTKTYESKYGTYNKEEKFKLNKLAMEEMAKNPSEFLYNIMDKDLWKLKVERKKMTQTEIEKALGYKIEIVQDRRYTNNEGKSSEEKKREVDEAIDEFEQIFGVKIPNRSEFY